LTERMLELSAQIVEREGVGIGVVDLSKDKKLAKKLQIFEIGALFGVFIVAMKSNLMDSDRLTFLSSSCSSLTSIQLKISTTKK